MQSFEASYSHMPSFSFFVFLSKGNLAMESREFTIAFYVETSESQTGGGN